MFQPKGNSRDENESHCAALNWMLKERTGYRRALRQPMKSEHRTQAMDYVRMSHSVTSDS